MLIDIENFKKTFYLKKAAKKFPLPNNCYLQREIASLLKGSKFIYLLG